MEHSQVERMLHSMDEMAKYMAELGTAMERTADSLDRIAQYIDEDLHDEIDSAFKPTIVGKGDVIPGNDSFATTKEPTPPDQCPECSRVGNLVAWREQYGPMSEYRCETDGTKWGRGSYDGWLRFDQ